jgi:hypothetical protein
LGKNVYTKKAAIFLKRGYMKNITIGTVIIATILCVPSIMAGNVDSLNGLANFKDLSSYVNTIGNSDDYPVQEKRDIFQKGEISDLLQDEQPILKIKDVTSINSGITITIANIGHIGASDIEIDIAVAEGLLVVIPRKHYEISEIFPGTSKSIVVSISGFGIGVLKPYPQITFTIHSPDSQKITGKISAKIIGSFVTIIEKMLDENKSFEGYTLFAPMWDRKTYLMDKSGTIVHSWTSIYLDTQAAYLLENGNLARASLVATSSLFAGGGQGRIELFDWNGKRLWHFEYSTDQYCQHHDIEPLPNGNFLLISWELKTPEEAINAGRNPAMVSPNGFWSDHIIEIEPHGSSGGNIVWEWHAWDHIIQQYDATKENYGIIAEHVELIDINYGGQRNDWLHINSIDYNKEFDQILLSVKTFNEIWVIDHSTTSNQAADHKGGRYNKGGDLLYRWGNPQAYKSGNADDQKLFGQHDARWIEPGSPGEGNILVFNNDGGGRNERYSTVDEIIPPVDENGNYQYSPGTGYGPKDQIWVYAPENPFNFYSPICSSSQRLPNGNTLICSASQGLFIEVSNKKQVIWSYVNQYPLWLSQKTVTEIYRYPPDYPGLRYLEG